MMQINHHHLAQSILLEESGNPLVMRTVVLFSFMLVLAFIGWANIAHVDEVALAIGEIQPMIKLQQIQHYDDGTIIEILVKDGETVNKDQVVLRLDTFVFRSELREAHAERESLVAQQKRLRAVLDESSPAMANDTKHESLHRILNTNGRLLEANPVIHEITNQRRRLEEQQKLIEEELTMKASMALKGYEAKLSLFTLRRDLSAVNADIAEINTKIVSEYTNVSNQLIRIAERIKRIEEKIRLAEIIAPTAGVVHGLRTHTIGGVIAKGDKIMEIVPMDSPLEAVIKIAPRDIGHVHVGQQVKLRFTAYDFSRYGLLFGVLNRISASALLNNDGTPYHQGVVSLNANYVGKIPGHHPVIAGMIVQSDIITGNKTVLEYLLKPIYTSAQQVFRER